ncbi:hypothetical protein ACFE04_009885 [Oxalis oulophora]
MDSVSVIGLLFLGVFFGGVTKVSSSSSSGGSCGCGFPAIYNFGDSNSDTGGISASLFQLNPPYGISFFGNFSGRACDGRLIIDLIAENLKLPYLNAYLDSVGACFRQGANFATGGSSIRPGGYSPFNLGIQINQFRQFKARTTLLYNQLSPNRQTPPFQSTLPKPGDFSKALYTLDIGQNDLGYGFQHTTAEKTRESIPDILRHYSLAVHALYNEGGRFFWVHNTGPIGCLFYTAVFVKDKPNGFDQHGCAKIPNDVAREFNRQLKEKVSLWRVQLTDAAFTYVDVYSAKYSLISNAKNLGFVDPFNFCCGSYYGYHINCGMKAVVNGTVYGNPCGHPSRHISWDGIHYTQAANMFIASQIVNGSLSDPPTPISEACCHV